MSSLHYQGKGLGHRPNAPGHYTPAHHLLAVRKTKSGLPLLAKPSLFEYRGKRIDQGAAGSCVAFASSRNLQLYFASNSMGSDILASPRQLYYDGRREEWAGKDPATVPPLEDTGTEPRLMMQSIQGLGFVPWDACPYSDDPKVIATQPAPSVYEKSYDQRGLQWAIAGEVGRARLARVRQSLQARVPVAFAMQVDEAFMNNHGERVTRVNGLSLVGGHMLAVLAVLDEDLIAKWKGPLGLPSDVKPDDVLIDNWWGLGTGDNGWGTKDGLGVLSSDVFVSTWISDVTLIEAAPPMLSKEAA